MTQSKFYKIIILCLSVLNVAILLYFLLHSSSIQKPRNIDTRSEVIEILQLDDEQAALFNDLADAHKSKMEELDKEKSNLIYAYFETLSDTTEMDSMEGYLIELEAMESEKVEATYQHFIEIKSILTVEQLSEYEVFVDKITQKLLSKE